MRALLILLILAALSGCSDKGGDNGPSLAFIPAVNNTNYRFDPNNSTVAFETSEAEDPPTIDFFGHSGQLTKDGTVEFGGRVDGDDRVADLIAACQNFFAIAKGKSFIAYNSKVKRDFCFKGRFVDTSILKLSDGRRFGTDFEPEFTFGAWVDIDDPTHIFKFESSGEVLSGCEIADKTITPFNGTYQAMDLKSGILDRITGLFVQFEFGTVSYTGNFEGTEGMILKSRHRTVKLQHEKFSQASCS